MQRITKALPGFIICFPRSAYIEKRDCTDRILPCAPNLLHHSEPPPVDPLPDEYRYLVFDAPMDYDGQFLSLLRLDADDQLITSSRYCACLGPDNVGYFRSLYLYGHADISVRRCLSRPTNTFSGQVRTEIPWVLVKETHYQFSCPPLIDRDQELLDDYFPTVSIKRVYPH